MQSATIIRGFIDHAIAQQLEAGHAWRCVQYARAQAKVEPASNSEVQAIAGGYAVYAGASAPLNRAAGLGMTGTITNDDLAQIEAFYRRHQVLPRIELCPLADPALCNLLQERGYQLEFFLNVLCRPIPDAPIPVVLPTDALIAQASPAQADEWIRTTTQGFEGVEIPSSAGLQVQAPTFYSEDGFCYLAWVGQELAAGGAMICHNQVVELGGTSTRLPFRRRGLQTALIHTRLNAARALGCTFAISSADPGSASQQNMERAGFQVAYTKAFMVGVHARP